MCGLLKLNPRLLRGKSQEALFAAYSERLAAYRGEPISPCCAAREAPSAELGYPLLDPRVERRADEPSVLRYEPDRGPVRASTAICW